MTISPMACAAIDRVFEQTMREIVPVDASDHCSFSWREAPSDAIVGSAPGHIATCNISAFGFRIVVFFEFADDAATAKFLREKFRIRQADGDRGFPVDACAEFINMVVGGAKARLTSAVPYTGLSTPVFLKGRFASHVSALRPSHSRTLEVGTGSGCHFETSYCVCVGRKSNVDFTIDARAPELESAGELELF